MTYTESPKSHPGTSGVLEIFRPHAIYYVPVIRLRRREDYTRPRLPGVGRWYLIDGQTHTVERGDTYDIFRKEKRGSDVVIRRVYRMEKKKNSGNNPPTKKEKKK